MVDKGILQAEVQSNQALLASLRNSKWTPLLDTFGFIENCVARIVQHPVRYLDILEASQLTVSDKKPLCLLACCIAEQWAYVAKNPDKKARKNIAEWIARFFSALEQIGENVQVMAELQEDMMKASDEKLQSILQKAFEKQQKKPSVAVPGDKTQDLPRMDMPQITDSTSITTVDLNVVFGPPSKNPSSIGGLDRWDQVDLDLAVANGRVSRLVQCAASPEEEVRRQAYHTIQSLMRIVEVRLALHHVTAQQPNQS